MEPNEAIPNSGLIPFIYPRFLVKNKIKDQTPGRNELCYWNCITIAQTCKQEYASAGKVLVEKCFVLINEPLLQITAMSTLMPIILLYS